MIGALLNDARREGLIVATDDYRRSRRREIGGRRVRVWRSLLAGQQRLDT
jgi:hypothetical protein